MQHLKTLDLENEELVVPAWIEDDLRVQAFVINAMKSSGNLQINS